MRSSGERRAVTLSPGEGEGGPVDPMDGKGKGKVVMRERGDEFGGRSSEGRDCRHFTVARICITIRDCRVYQSFSPPSA